MGTGRSARTPVSSPFSLGTRGTRGCEPRGDVPPSLSLFFGMLFPTVPEGPPQPRVPCSALAALRLGHSTTSKKNPTSHFQWVCGEGRRTCPYPGMSTALGFPAEDWGVQHGIKCGSTTSRAAPGRGQREDEEGPGGSSLIRLLPFPPHQLLCSRESSEHRLRTIPRRSPKTGGNFKDPAFPNYSGAGCDPNGKTASFTAECK